MSRSASTMRAAALRREVLLFVALTFSITWGILWTLIATDLPEFPTVLPAIYGPTLSALVLTGLLYGRAGLKRFVARLGMARLGWGGYAFLLFGFAALGYAGHLLWAAARGLTPELAVPSLGFLLPVLVFQVLVPGLGEELGWRGFALQRLQHLMTPLKASLLLGLVHLLWHLPTYWLGQGIHNVPILWSALYILPWSILFTWFYNHTRGSLLGAVLFHSLHGVMLSLVAFLPAESVVRITPSLLTSLTLPDGLLGPYLFVVLLYWVLALAVMAGAFGGLGTPPAFEHEAAAETPPRAPHPEIAVAT